MLNVKKKRAIDTVRPSIPPSFSYVSLGPLLYRPHSVGVIRRCHLSVTCVSLTLGEDTITVCLCSVPGLCVLIYEKQTTRRLNFIMLKLEVTYSLLSEASLLTVSQPCGAAHRLQVSY